MKRYVEVYWCPFFVDNVKDVEQFIALELLMQEPKPVINKLFVERKDAKYLECPAVTDSLKNVFVVEAPFDLVYTLDKETGAAKTDRFGQNFFEKFTLLRSHQTRPEYPALITLPPRFLCYSKEQVIAQVMDVPVLQSETARNTKIIPGQYDISKWVRSLDWSFELSVGDTVTMRKGDPLFAVKFNTLGNVPVKLVRVKNSEELVQTVRACVNVKAFSPNLKLQTLYNLAKDFLSVRKPK